MDYRSLRLGSRTPAPLLPTRDASRNFMCDAPEPAEISEREEATTAEEEKQNRLHLSLCAFVLTCFVFKFRINLMFSRRVRRGILLNS